MKRGTRPKPSGNALRPATLLRSRAGGRQWCGPAAQSYSSPTCQLPPDLPALLRRFSHICWPTCAPALSSEDAGASARRSNMPQVRNCGSGPGPQRLAVSRRLRSVLGGPVEIPPRARRLNVCGPDSVSTRSETSAPGVIVRPGRPGRPSRVQRSASARAAVTDGREEGGMKSTDQAKAVVVWQAGENRLASRRRGRSAVIDPRSAREAAPDSSASDRWLRGGDRSPALMWKHAAACSGLKVAPCGLTQGSSMRPPA